MDEIELTRRLLASGDGDREAIDRARAQLRAAILKEQMGRAPAPRRRVAWIAAAAACVAMVLTLTSVLWFLNEPSATAKALGRLSTVAAAASGPDIGPDRFLLTRSEELRPEASTSISGTFSSFTIVARLSNDIWVAADGTGVQRTAVSSVSFASSADRAAWEAAGRPELLANAGTSTTEHYGPRDPIWVDVGALPVDPSDLEEALRRRQSHPSDDNALFQQVGDILALGDTPPAVRASLFQVTSDIPGVQLVGDVTDPLGRAGIGIAFDANGERTRLVFDAESSRLLALETYRFDADGSVGDISAWRAYQPSEIVPTAPS